MGAALRGIGGAVSKECAAPQGHHSWEMRLPERTGRHMVFVQWIRSDSPENFFSRSDVVFDRGDGEVTRAAAPRCSGTGAGGPVPTAEPVVAVSPPRPRRRGPRRPIRRPVPRTRGAGRR
ncbi:lytic polysaccharide monooxygenase [Streptomyces citrinus]|uniref:lytic polysaccharide monooxygenase n=1 Tax=Streptomyces citrinus TaxID=3118173 RepID=UPI003CC5DB94